MPKGSINPLGSGFRPQVGFRYKMHKTLLFYFQKLKKSLGREDSSLPTTVEEQPGANYYTHNAQANSAFHPSRDR